jgi:hypothetical protein
MDNIDHSRKEEASPGDAEAMVETLRRAFPDYWVWHDPVALKRFEDEMAMALSGQDTSPEEDARLKQESLEDEPTMSREADDKFWANAEGWSRERFRRL